MKEQECAKFGRKMALWFSLPAALVVFGILISKVVDIFFKAQQRQAPNMALGALYYVVAALLILGLLYLSATRLGQWAGKLIFRRTGLAWAIFTGVVLALACLFGMAAMWFVYSLIMATAAGVEAEAALIVASLFGLAIAIYGLLPAIGLGVVYGIIVRRRCLIVGGPEV
jgi:hypothetical protein